MSHALIHWINNDNASVVGAGKLPEEMKSGEKVGKLGIKKTGAATAKKYDARVLSIGTRQECKNALDDWCERRERQAKEEADLSRQSPSTSGESSKSQSQSDPELPLKLKSKSQKSQGETLTLFDTLKIRVNCKGQQGDHVTRKPSREDEKKEEVPQTKSKSLCRMVPESQSLGRSPSNSESESPTKSPGKPAKSPGKSTSSDPTSVHMVKSTQVETMSLTERMAKLERRVESVEKKLSSKTKSMKKPKESRPKVEVVDIKDYVEPMELAKVVADDEVKMTKELMEIIFTDRELREGTRTGTTSAKAGFGVKRKKLEPRKVSAIYTYVGERFPEVPPKRLRRSIGTSIAEKCRDVRNTVKAKETSDVVSGSGGESGNETVIISDDSPMKTPWRLHRS